MFQFLQEGQRAPAVLQSSIGLFSCDLIKYLKLLGLGKNHCNFGFNL